MNFGIVTALTDRAGDFVPRGRPAPARLVDRARRMAEAVDLADRTAPVFDRDAKAFGRQLRAWLGEELA